MRLCKYPIPPQTLPSIGGYCLQQLVLRSLPNGDFLFPSFCLHACIGILCKEELSLLLQLFIHSTIHLYQYGLMDIFFYGLYSNTSVIYSVAPIVLAWVLGSPFRLMSSSYDKLRELTSDDTLAPMRTLSNKDLVSKQIFQ